MDGRSPSQATVVMPMAMRERPEWGAELIPDTRKRNHQPIAFPLILRGCDLTRE
ncbi:MAG: hypothetical protein GX131_06930 [candidate division WS1 bacterium]|jgi:hypothetical protein|nr:hypothetical protein [candidate division WS1 bacterium]